MKQRLLFAFLLLSLCAGLQAQTARKFELKNSADGLSTLYAFLPQHPTGRAVVCCPGGGYEFLAMQSEGTDWAPYFNNQGIAFFVLKYRMPHGDRSLPIGDALQAMQTVRDSARAWHINPSDVGIMGSSAGGHLASTVCTHAGYALRPDFAILFYPVITMEETQSHAGSTRNLLGDERFNEEVVREYSNHLQVQRHLTPRTLVLLANDDGLVPPLTNGVAYYTAMRQAGNECAMYVYPTGGHGFGFQRQFEFHDQLMSDLSAWLSSFRAPRQDAVRVACIGNSITDGMGIDMAEAEGYPARLQQLLGEGYRVMNFGVSARTVLNKGDWPYQHERAWRDALSYNPDRVVLMLGTNDSKPYNWQHGSEFEHDYQQLIDSLQALSAKPRISLCTPIPGQNLSWGINDSTISRAIIPIIRRLAKRNGLPLIDLHARFSNKDGRQLQRDGVHPTARGAAQLAEIVCRELKKN